MDVDSTPAGAVRSTVRGRAGLLRLDRPDKINALDLAMIDAARDVLERWRDDDRVRVVVLEGEGERGFCAGGDIRAVHDGARVDPASVRRLWRHEYALDLVLATYPEPVVTIAHGLTMGGGMGLASHARHRVVTPDAVLAMPEVGIGLAPDVGGLLLLARAPGELGTLAALTGARLDAGDAVHLGLADHVVPAADVQHLVADLATGEVEPALARWSVPPPPSPLAAARSWVDACFSGDDATTIARRLEHRTEPGAAQALEALLAAAPTAVAVTLAALRRAARLPDLRSCLVQDYRVCCRFLEHPDLVEGIRAQVVDRDRSPRWRPSALDAVSRADVEAFLQPLDRELELSRG